MNKRRERLSPVIEAERRKSGVLERRAHGLEAECAQLGRDLKMAREAIAKSVETIRALQVQLAQERERYGDLFHTFVRRGEDLQEAQAFATAPLSFIAAQRLRARFRRPA